MKLISLNQAKWKKIGNRILAFCRLVLLPPFLFLLSLSLLLGSMALTISAAVCGKTRDRILDKNALLETGLDFDCILVLGCRVYSDGRLSHMLSDRVETAVELYAAGFCDRLLMSGDHKDDSYNEVDPMKAAAEGHGVPSDAISTDPMGLSTYDSIMRFAAENPGARILIVTQSYHLYRALYLAEKAGLEAYGVSADLRTYRGQIKYDLREIAARCKDVYYAEKRPAAAGMQERAVHVFGNVAVERRIYENEKLLFHHTSDHDELPFRDFDRKSAALIADQREKRRVGSLR